MKVASLWAVLLLFSSPAWGARPDIQSGSPSVLSVAADEWFPVNGQPASDHPGFAIEILEAIFEPLGIDVDYRLSGWSRSLEMARNGQVDCVIGAYHGDAPALLFPRTPVALDDLAFYVDAASQWQYQGPASLDQVSIGAIADYSYGELLDGYLREHASEDRIQMIHGLKPLERNIGKLLSGRIDVLVESQLVMESMIERQRLGGKVREAGRIGLSEPVFLACSPDKSTTPEYLRLFDEGMARLRESGELARIMTRYGLPVPPLPAQELSAP